MKRDEPDLFSVARVRLPSTSDAAPKRDKAAAGTWPPFDDWDHARMEPRPDAVIPEWLSLPSDDPNWRPTTRFG